MSEADFEVMPRGTAVELRRLRRFANDMIELNAKFAFPKDVVDKIEELKKQ